MIKKLKSPFSNDNCFFCGSQNEMGLKLDFNWDEKKKEAFTEFEPGLPFSGRGDLFHRSIQTWILDEIMDWTSFAYSNMRSLTSDLKIKFLHPIYITGNKIKATCRILSGDEPRINMKAVILNHENTTCTVAVGSYHRILPLYKCNREAPPFPSDSFSEELEWLAGPERDMGWREAREWVENLKGNEERWRMPTITELEHLFNLTGSQAVKTRNLFRTSGWWIWSGDEDGPLSALGFDIVLGKPCTGGRSLIAGGRVFAVRSVK